MSYRKITVDGIEYEYVVGRLFVKVKGLWVKYVEDVGMSIGDNKVIVAPRHIAYYIKHNKKYVPEHICVHCKSTDNVRFTVDPFKAEIYDIKLYNFYCKNCYDEIAMKI